MGEYSFETVWPKPSDDVQKEVVDFWLKEAAMSQGTAIERAAQLVVVCHDDKRSIAAVSTAFPFHVGALGLRCLFFRALVGRAHRARGLLGSRLIYQLTRHSYDVLNRRFQSGVDLDTVGLYFEIQNPSIQRHRRELVWSDEGANIVFLGQLANGNHIRVWYFENAKIPPDF